MSLERPPSEADGQANEAPPNPVAPVPGQPLPFKPNIYGVLDLTAEVIHLANVAAKAFCAQPKMKAIFYGIKDSLLSTLLQEAVPGVEPSWDTKPGTDRMLRVSIARRRRVHCPFRRLSAQAQSKVIERLGASPG